MQEKHRRLSAIRSALRLAHRPLPAPGLDLHRRMQIREVRDGMLRTADPELIVPLAEVLG